MESTDAQNKMLDNFVRKHPQFGPKPDTTPPVLHTDGERLEEARRALQNVMGLAFRQAKEPAFREIWGICNSALAQTGGSANVDTVP